MAENDAVIVVFCQGAVFNEQPDHAAAEHIGPRCVSERRDGMPGFMSPR